MVTSRVLSVSPFRLGCGSAVVRLPYGNEPLMYPVRCTRPFQCTRDVPGEAGWARRGANRAGRKCRPKCFILRGLWSFGGRARTDKNGEEQTDGAQGRNRTTDTAIFKPTLPTLSVDTRYDSQRAGFASDLIKRDRTPRTAKKSPQNQTWRRVWPANMYGEVKMGMDTSRSQRSGCKPHSCRPRNTVSKLASDTAAGETTSAPKTHHCAPKSVDVFNLGRVEARSAHHSHVGRIQVAVGHPSH
jgi:hypothetical protein